MSGGDMGGSAGPFAPAVKNLHDCRGCFLDRTARNVYYRPVAFGEKATRGGDLVSYSLRIDVIRVMVVVEKTETVPADLDEVFRILRQSNNEGGIIADQVIEFAWQRNIGDDRYIGGLKAPVCKIDAGRCLRRARDADEDDVGTSKIVSGLSVVMIESKRHRVDSLEILGVQDVLSPGLTPTL